MFIRKNKKEKNIIYNVLIAAVMLLLTALSDIVVRLLIDVPLPVFKAGWLAWLVVFLFLYCLSFAPRFIMGAGFLFVWIIQTTGLCHWFYFGRIIAAMDIINFAKAHNSVLKLTYLMDICLPFMLSLATLAIGITAFVFLSKRTLTKKPYLIACVLIVLFIPSYSVLNSIKKEWQPNSSFPIAVNVIYAFTYSVFYGDNCMNMVKDDYLPYKTESSGVQVNKILFVLTDSWSLPHLKEFGYNRETMPYLSARLEENKNYKMHTAIAPSVDTLVSVPSIFNNIREPFNQKEALKRTANLLYIAKKNGYKTHVYTAHADFVFNESGREYIDDYIYDVQDEEQMLSLLSKIDLKSDSKEFIVLHYFSVHSPYIQGYERYKNKFEKFTPINPLDKISYTINTYDNALLHMDSMVDNVISYFDAVAGAQNTAVFLTADHAELFNYNGSWGHGLLVTEGAKVPLIIRSVYDDLPLKWVPFWLVSENLARHLGAKIINPNLQENDFFIVDEFHFIKYRVDDGVITELDKQ